MRRGGWLVVTGLAPLVTLVLCTGIAPPSLVPRSARSTVDAFCAGDFDAKPARDSLVIYSPAAERQAKRLVGSEGFPLVDWTWDPLVIVTRYAVLGVQVADSTGTARVRFDVVGRSQGRYQVVPTKPKTVVDSLRLVRRGARWWILDPPLARVSVDAEIGEYSSSLASQDSSWFFGAALPQLDVYSAELRALIALKRIAAAAGHTR